MSSILKSIGKYRNHDYRSKYGNDFIKIIFESKIATRFRLLILYSGIFLYFGAKTMKWAKIASLLIVWSQILILSILKSRQM